MGGEIDIPYFAIMNMAVVVQKVVGITMNLKQSKHGTEEQNEKTKPGTKTSIALFKRKTPVAA